MDIEKPHYNFEAAPDSLIFEFESVSDNKTIKKVVLYEKIEEYDNLYQLSFGDLISENTIDYLAISQNKDRDKVLFTVAKTMLVFFENYPKNLLYFRGSNDVRTRLYRTYISRFIEIIELNFQVFGLNKEGKLEKFIKNKNYEAFIISHYGKDK